MLITLLITDRIRLHSFLLPLFIGEELRSVFSTKKLNDTEATRFGTEIENGKREKKKNRRSTSVPREGPGGTQQSFEWRGSAARSKPLTFFKTFFDSRKGNPFIHVYIFHKKWYPFHRDFSTQKRSTRKFLHYKKPKSLNSNSRKSFIPPCYQYTCTRSFGRPFFIPYSSFFILHSIHSFPALFYTSTRKNLTPAFVYLQPEKGALSGRIVHYRKYPYAGREGAKTGAPFLFLLSSLLFSKVTLYF